MMVLKKWHYCCFSRLLYIEHGCMYAYSYTDDKYSDSISSDEELSFSNDEDDEDDEAMVSVDHYETLVSGRNTCSRD